MKKWLIFSVLCFLICGCNYQKQKTIDGSITVINQDFFIIQVDKTTYEFTYHLEDNLSIMDIVSVTYVGTLNAKKQIQPVTIKKVSLLKKAETTPPKEEITGDYPTDWNDQGIYAAYYQKAYKTLQSMSLQAKINQMFLVRVPKEKQVEIIKQNQFGGIVLFAKDFKNLTQQQVINEIKSYQQVSKIPLLTATDEEGGTVVRISSNSLLANKPFLSPQQLYQQGGFSLIKQDTINKVKLLQTLGVNLLLAPVSDVSTDPKDYIYDRSFGQDAKNTANYIKEMVTTLKDNHMSMTLKHFPGYGNNIDTHTGIAIDNRPLSQFESSDFLPFEAGIEAGAESILVSHNIVNDIDPRLPASLSLKMHEILRNELHFTGIIITDDLFMDAISKYTKNVDPVVQAILAGNDLLTITDYESAYNSITKALQDGIIEQEQIDHAVFRILAWKYSKGLLS